MAGGPIQLWNEWATQILILLSFTLQLVLFVFAGTRWRGSSTVVTILLWLAYLMADSTAVYTLGHLSITDSPGKHKLVVFWAPFLLVHLGSQDTITAYALEDNQLWSRHLLTLGVQSFGVAYVLYNHITELPTSLGRATVLMFIVGIIKYGERIWALRSAGLDSIRSSFNDPQHVEMDSALHYPWLVLIAHAMLPICKGAMVDQPVYLSGKFGDAPFGVTCHLDLDWKDRCRVVEIELSLMYDVLYTKAAVIYTWYGYLSRLVWPLATIAAFLLFQLSENKYGYSRVDVAITYILLVGAFLLDMASLFRALGSTWTCSFLLNRGWSKLGHVAHFIMFLHSHVKSGGGWSGSVGQFNLLQFTSRRTNYYVVRYFPILAGVELALSKRLYTETLVISQDFKEMVYQHVGQVLTEVRDGDVNEKVKRMFGRPVEILRRGSCYKATPAAFVFLPESWLDNSQWRKTLDESLGFGSYLQEAILTCHILTDVFLLCSSSSTKDEASPSIQVQAIKALSDYLIFLVTMQPDTILGLELRYQYEETRKTLQHIKSVDAGGARFREKNIKNVDKEWLARYLRDHGCNSNKVISSGAKYANLLLDLVDISKPDKRGVISSYKESDTNAMPMFNLKRLLPDLEPSCRDGVFDMPKALAVIFDAWVRLLISVSVRRSRDAHAGQLNRGSELTTVVWLMVEHAQVFHNATEDTEHDFPSAWVFNPFEITDR